MMEQIKVLLVDDDEGFTAPLAERLETRGMIVRVAHDGSGALNLIAETVFDAVILDVIMPGLDGMETLRLMLERQPTIQVVMLTGHAQLEQGIAAVKAGAMDYLEKPFDFSELLKKIGEAKSRRTEQDEKQVQKDVDGIIKRKGW